MGKAVWELIFQAVDGTIADSDFDRLQDAIESDPEVRSAYLRAVAMSESLRDVAIETPHFDKTDTVQVQPLPSAASESGSLRRQSSLLQLAIVALVMAAVGGIAFWVGQRNSQDDAQQIAEDENVPANEASREELIAGHATLRRAVDLQWAVGTNRYREGDILREGELRFDEGIAEIDFFCGATLIVEGPAKLNVESDWSVQVLEGRLRVNVPTVARGFIVKAAGSEIIDLGTEFALDVGADQTRVEVIDGEVELRGGEHDGKHLLTGDNRWLKGDSGAPHSFDDLATAGDVVRRRDDAASLRMQRWQQHSRRLQSDQRMIAYYPMLEALNGRILPNAAVSGAVRDGRLVGPVERTSGRFNSSTHGLAFHRRGSRVRTRIDGEYTAFTFACWARIDSLDNVYNALFMSDGYENGEPHWQIRDDGRLMFSVMVDDSQDVRVPNRFDEGMVRDAGLHRVYMTKPIWDVTRSGQWFHLAAVYDPAERRVRQYVNGRMVSEQEIIDKFYIDTLRIGAAEIGNWGQPFRKSPWFAVRNLNGTIDELAVFDAALSGEEIEAIHEQGKPLGY